jgi:peptide/nickel transport system ATP-binding protein
VSGDIPAAQSPLLEIDGLSISYSHRGHRQTVLHEASLSIAAGQVVALVGESGSGKSTLAQSLIGLLPDNGQIDGGAIRFDGANIARWTQRRFDTIRGTKISLVPQDPGVSLNPVRTIGAQVGEIFQIHGLRDPRERQERVLDLLDRVGLSQPRLRLKQYPHELSGGLKQRVLIAIAVALRPRLIIADEPTTALDVTVQKRILDLIDDLRREYDTAVLLVTHDLSVAAERADRLVILKAGRVQEQGLTDDVLGNPRSSYTATLLADAPSMAKTAMHRAASPDAHPIPANVAPAPIVVENLVVDYRYGRSAATFRAVDGISFTVPAGTTHGLVGESGSGKTTAIRTLVGFVKPTGGRVLVDGVDVASLKGQSFRHFRKSIQLVYQNPFASLDPRQTVAEILTEPLLNFEPIERSERERRVREMLDRVGLPATALARQPRSLSGGQRQRVAIARALISDPKILLLDEAVSALDVTVQAQILSLIDDLQRELGLTYVFVSHDLAVVRQIADTVSVVRQGRIIESGPTSTVFSHPVGDYTRELIDAVPGRRLLLAG